MPFIDQEQIYYENIKEQKYYDIKAEILRRYFENIESKIYPLDRIYPTRKWLGFYFFN